MAVVTAALSLVLVLGAFVSIAWAWWQTRRPLTEMDRKCSRIDVDLDDLRAEGSVRHYVGGGWRA